jgi:hypothetical protein
MRFEEIGTGMKVVGGFFLGFHMLIWGFFCGMVRVEGERCWLCIGWVVMRNDLGCMGNFMKNDKIFNVVILIVSKV